MRTKPSFLVSKENLQVKPSKWPWLGLFYDNLSRRTRQDDECIGIQFLGGESQPAVVSTTGGLDVLGRIRIRLV
jgi:hypothetical protein